MQRRTFIRLVGGGTVLAAVGGGLFAYGARSVFPVPDSAIAAWELAGREADPRRHALSFAILAPNPHNMQPWRADLRVPGEIAISLDPGRLLPETDPFGRQITFGLGCFLELLVMAAASHGYAAEISLLPDGDPGPRLDGRRMAIVRLRESTDVAADPLFTAVRDRRTDRRPYDPGRPPTPPEIDALVRAAAPVPVRFGVEAGAKLDGIKTIARTAWATELVTQGPMMESMRLLRIGTAEIDRYRDGVVIEEPMLVMLAKTGLFDRSVMPTPDSIATTSQIEEFDAATASTPAYLWIVTEGNMRQHQIDAGRAYLRAALATTLLGLALHPNQQALQEYPAVAQEYKAIHRLLDADAPGQTVQMLARLGRPAPGAAPLAPAPRRGLAAHLV